jgi:hypothetical protein
MFDSRLFLTTVIMPTRQSTPKANRSIRQMTNRVVEQVMGTELDELTRFKRGIHSALKIVVMVWQDFFQNLVKLQAMALAFKTCCHWRRFWR